MKAALFAIAFCSTGFLISIDKGIAVDFTATLTPFVGDDTFTVGCVRLDLLQSEEAGEESRLFLLPRLSTDGQEWLSLAKTIEQAVRGLHESGVDKVLVVHGLSDLHLGGSPLLIFPVEAAGKQVEAEKLLRFLAEAASTVMPQWIGKLDVRLHDKNVILAGSAATLDRYATKKGAAREDLLGPIASLIGAGEVAVAAVFSPGVDFRRVVRELWPELPGQLAPLRGELADRWLRLEFAATTTLEPDAELALQAADAGAAETLVKLLRALPDAAEQFTELGERRHELKRYLESILAAVPPQQEGNRVRIALPGDEEAFARLRQVAADAADAAMESTRRHKRMDQFKQLGIAFQNHYDIHKHLPASAAIRSPDGKPLLSWRVAVLPYLGESGLYRQFRLDEPWDSPHNRKLIEKMPAVFADPDPQIRRVAGPGKTTYQVPTGPKTAFYKDEGASFREIADGTSRTILVVEVEPSQAVEWTKPADWQVDIENPRQGLERSDRRYFTAGFADAHVQIIDLDKIDDATLRAFLTRAGREAIQQ